MQIKQRYADFYASDTLFSDEHVGYYRKKWSSLSEFIKTIKQTFSQAFNKLHQRRGTLWGERFKRLIVEDGETLISCLATIDLNPIRAGIVKRPEDYRLFQSKHEKIPKAIKGLSGLYSMKRLSEAISNGFKLATNTHGLTQTVRTK